MSLLPLPGCEARSPKPPAHRSSPSTHHRHKGAAPGRATFIHSEQSWRWLLQPLASEVPRVAGDRQGRQPGSCYSCWWKTGGCWQRCAAAPLAAWGGCRAEPYLGGERDRLPGAGAQFVDLRLGDVGPLLGIIQLVLHLAVLHQVGVGLLLLGAADGVRGVWGALPTPPPVPGLPGSPREGRRCPRRAEQGRALTASSNWRL